MNNFAFTNERLKNLALATERLNNLALATERLKYCPPLTNLEVCPVPERPLAQDGIPQRHPVPTQEQALEKPRVLGKRKRVSNQRLL